MANQCFAKGSPMKNFNARGIRIDRSLSRRIKALTIKLSVFFMKKPTIVILDSSGSSFVFSRLEPFCLNSDVSATAITLLVKIT